MIDRKRLVEEFSTLVSIDSPSYSERQMGDYIKKTLASLGIEAREDSAGEKIGGNCGNIFAFFPGELSLEPLLFCVHMDTVEPSKGKRAVVSEDGVIRSGGDTVLGADDLAGVAAILEALRVIKEKNIPHRPIELIFTVAEERYIKGARQLDFSNIRSKECYVLDLTGSVGGAAYMAPSIISFASEIKGRASHAGFAPEAGVHAIAAAAKAIGSIAMGRIDGETTVNVGIIEGGLATNIVPERCLVRGEIRSYSHEKALAQAELVKGKFIEAAEALGARAEVKLEIESIAYGTPLDHPVVRRFEKACQNEGLAPSLQKTFGGSDLNHIAQNGIYGLVVANAMNACHSTEEYTTVGELENIARLTLALMCSED